MGVIVLRASVVSHQERLDMLLSKVGREGKLVSLMETEYGVMEYEKGAVSALLGGIKLETGGTVESKA